MSESEKPKITLEGIEERVEAEADIEALRATTLALIARVRKAHHDIINAIGTTSVDAQYLMQQLDLDEEYLEILQVMEESAKRTARIILELRKGPDEDSISEEKKGPSTKENLELLAGKRIAWIDDNPTWTNSVGMVLDSKGYHVFDSADGFWEAFSKGLSVDLIVSDMEMPGQTGKDLFERISLEQPSLLERLVFCSGGTSDPDCKALLKSGKVFTLSKEENGMELFNRLAQHVREKGL